MAITRTVVPIVLVVAFLNGCAMAAGVKIASLALTGASYLISGKSLSDHVISGAMASDCALHRLVTGQPPCRPSENTENTLVAQASTGQATAAEPQLDSTQAVSEASTNISSGPTLLETDWEDLTALENNFALLDTDFIVDSTGPRLFVVVGSYSELSNAHTHLSREDGAQIASVIVDNTRYFRVLLGPFGSSISTLARSETGLKSTGGWPVWLCPGALRAPPCTTQIAQLTP